MQDAERQLEAGSGEKASRSAEEARRYLEQARQELERERRRYEALRQEEVLFRLVEDLKEFRKEQARIREEVARISDAAGGRPLARGPRKAIRALAGDEARLRARVDERVKVLREEGSAAFGSSLEIVGVDMAEVARLLEEEVHGTHVQGLADDVGQQLTELIQAFEDEIERRKEPPKDPQGQSPPQGRAPLVPPMVELKLLRRMQMDLNAKVEAFWRLNPSVREGAIDDRQKRTIERLYNRQAKIADDLQKLIDSVYGHQ
jgi:predicted metal-dependent hydrolase